MELVGWLILAVVSVFAAIELRSLFRDARGTGVFRLRSIARMLPRGPVFVVVMLATAVVTTRLVGGPFAAPDDCAGDECDANMIYVVLFPLVGVPAGIIAGVLATEALRRARR